MENYESTSSQEFAHVQKKPWFLNSGFAFVVASYIAVASASVGNIMKETSSKPYQVSPQVEEVQSQFSKNLVEVYHQNGIEIDIPYDLAQKISFVSLSGLEYYGKIQRGVDGSYIIGIDFEGIKNIRNSEGVEKFLNPQIVESYIVMNELGNTLYHNVVTNTLELEYNRSLGEMAGDVASFIGLKNDIESGNGIDSLVAAIYFIDIMYNKVNIEDDYSLSFHHMADNFEIVFGSILDKNSLQKLFNIVIDTKYNGDFSGEGKDLEDNIVTLIDGFEQSFNSLIAKNIAESQREITSGEFLSGFSDEKINKTKKI